MATKKSPPPSDAVIWREAQSAEAHRRIAILVSCATAIATIGRETQEELRDPTMNGTVVNAVEELIGQAAGQNALIVRLGGVPEAIESLADVLGFTPAASTEVDKSDVVVAKPGVSPWPFGTKPLADRAIPGDWFQTAPNTSGD
jgi:hypothetical protein